MECAIWGICHQEKKLKGVLAMNTNSGKDHSLSIALALPAAEEFSSLHLRRDLQSHPCPLQLPSRRLWPPTMAEKMGKEKIPIT